MYKCPNCAGNLVYDISTKKLHCTHCGTFMEICELPEEKEAEEHVDEYKVTVFTCPYCGGEILTQDTTAATFCSFCGSSTLLDTRVSNEKRPSYIIPFEKTIEDCKESYKRLMKRAIYAPSELKKMENIDKFRGIYMPYGVYSLYENKRIRFQGSTRKRKWNYVYHDLYCFDTDIVKDYDGLAFDLASSFADDLSISIAPFDMEDKKEFSPAYLSGFYADINDVPADIYNVDVKSIVVEDVTRKIMSDKILKKYAFTEEELYKNFVPLSVQSEYVLLPVWFLACQKDNRVTYAVVNGQTGKAGADLPIDMKKIMFGTVLTTFPIALLLNLLFTVTPKTLLWVVIILILLFEGILMTQLLRVRCEEEGMNDKGIKINRYNKRNSFKEEEVQIKKHIKSKKNKELIEFIFLLAFFFLFELSLLTYIILFLVGLFLVVSYFSKIRLIIKTKMKEKKLLYPPLLGMLLALVTLIFKPVNDIYYYITVILSLPTLVYSTKNIIKLYNRFVTRKLPFFNTRGGDQNA